MKFSEVTIKEIKDYARVEYDDEDNLFTSILLGAKAHIRAYTGLKDEKLDELDDTVIALYIISNEMYENRVMTNTDSRNSKLNEVLERILGSHSVNLL